MNKSNLNFGQALEALRDGMLIARKEWTDMFVFQRPEDELPYDVVVQSVKSIPLLVKNFLYFNANDEKGKPVELSKMPPIKFTAYLCLKSSDGSIVNGWSPSQLDMQANDWYLLQVT